MISGSPLRWSDPATWPWFVCVWLALFTDGWAKELYDALRRMKSASWPATTGRIEGAAISPPRAFLGLTMSPAGRGPSPVELRYSYSVDGQNYSGRLKQDFPNLAAAQEFARGLQGMPVTVHYDPESFSTSMLLESSVRALLQARRPAPAEARATGDSIPNWLRVLLWPFVALSAVGLLLSMWVHFGALLGRRVAPPEYFWMLHMGIFVVWIPAVLVAQKQPGNPGGRDAWKAAMQRSPKWMNYMVTIFFVYALVNFLLFMLNTPSGKPHGADTPPEVWRGFSGHWMLFYSAAFAMLYPAAKTNSASARCMNGHPLPPGAAVCPQCGQPANLFG